MHLLAVSKDTIRAHVIRYFHDFFGTPISAFKPSTNVRKAYHYQDDNWRGLADVFSKFPWMIQLGVVLTRPEMPPLKTIEDLTTAIWGKLNKLVAVTGLSAPVRVSRVKTLSGPKSRSKTRKKATRKKTTRRKKTSG